MVSMPASDNITGRTYLENGTPVRVLVRWSSERAAPWSGIPVVLPRADGKPHVHRGPHNVLIEREDGSRVVRSFRGLRRISSATEDRGDCV
jgi:hypothetical protein